MIVNCVNGSFFISDLDYELVSNHKWQIMSNGNGKQYVRRTHKDPKTGKYFTLLLHRTILGVSNGVEVDHINCNGLDNRRENLRVVLSSQQRMNSKIRKNKKWSLYKGVSRHPRSGKYVTQVMLSNRHMFWREYEDECIAAWMYDIVAGDLFGQYSRLNFVSNEV